MFESSAGELTNRSGESQDLDRRIAALFATEPEAVANPWPLWRELSALAPVVESGPQFLVTRNAEVKAVHKDVARFSSDSRRRGSRAIAIRAGLTPERRAAFDEISDFHAIWMQTTDSPTHDRLRNIAIRAFTPRRIAALGDATRRYVGQAIETMADESTSDLMDMALNAPLMIMTDLLGIPPQDREMIKEYSRNWFEFQFVADDRIFISRDAQRGLKSYVEQMLASHRRDPSATDLVETLVGAEHEERLNADELAAMFFLLLFAGHETTTNLIGTGMLELLARRDQWDSVVCDPTLIPAAVEEMLRFVSPVQFLNRVVTQDVEIAGTTVPTGGTVTTLLAAANRDPLVFDRPATFDISRRDTSNHVVFGLGPHFCLGAALSRLEGRIAVEALTANFPDMELAADQFQWRGGAQLRGLAALPVTPGRRKSASRV